MKNIFKTIFIATLALSVVSCTEEENEAQPFEPAFEINVSGEAPNAEITLTNNSEGVTSYQWVFSEGASVESSTSENPNSFTVDKSGEFTVTLIGTQGAEEKEVSQTVTIDGASAILVYPDVAFALNAGDAEFGRFFSFSTGEIILDSEVTEENGAEIDLAFGSLANTMYYFESPSESNFEIPNATVAQVINYEETPTVSPEAFEALEDDSLLSALTINGTDDSFGNSTIGTTTVLFQIADGRKGVILTKVVNSDRLLVDIKIQKY